MIEDQTVYVVTNPEMGWDCVVGVFTDELFVRTAYADTNIYAIHERTLSTEKVEGVL